MKIIISISVVFSLLALGGGDKSEPQKVATEQANSNVANSVATPTFEPIKKSNSKY